MKKLFTIGPVESYEITNRVRQLQLPYFRTSQFSDLINRIETKLLNLLKCASGSKLALLTSSGTGAMEASVSNFLYPNSRVLLISGGTFSDRFELILNRYGHTVDKVIVSYDEDLRIDHFDAFNPNDYSAIFVVHHETSIGKLFDLSIVKLFKGYSSALVIVDAMTSFLSDEFFMDNNIDVALISSHKGLALAPGISIVAYNNIAADILSSNQQKSPYYFDLNLYKIDMIRHQTPFTPAIGILLELDDMLSHIEHIGVDSRINEVSSRAAYFRRKLIGTFGFSIPNFSLSNAITPVFLKSRDAKLMTELLDINYDMIVNPCSGDLSDICIRISHVGNLDLADYDDLIRAMIQIEKKVENDR